MDLKILKIFVVMASIFLIFSSVFRLLNMYYVVYVVTLILLWAYLGQCWNICYGYAGLLSFGHAAFLGVGAYTSTLLLINYNVTPWIGMLIGGGAAALIGLIMGIPTLKLRGAYFALATIAVAEMVRLITLKLDFITNGPLGLLLPTNLSPLYFYFEDTFHWFIVSLAMLIALLAISYKLENSKLGMALRAVKENEAAAASLGVSLFKYKMIALLLSAFFTGVGGVFFAQFVGYIRPDIVLPPERSDEILLVPLLGGTGTLLGPVIGSVIFIALKHVFLAFFGGGMAGAYLILYGALIMFIVLFMPQGIYPYLSKILVRCKLKA